MPFWMHGPARTMPARPTPSQAAPVRSGARPAHKACAKAPRQKSWKIEGFLSHPMGRDIRPASQSFLLL